MYVIGSGDDWSTNMGQTLVRVTCTCVQSRKHLMRSRGTRECVTISHSVSELCSNTAFDRHIYIHIYKYTNIYVCVYIYVCSREWWWLSYTGLGGPPKCARSNINKNSKHLYVASKQHENRFLHVSGCTPLETSLAAKGHAQALPGCHGANSHSTL